MSTKLKCFWKLLFNSNYVHCLHFKCHLAEVTDRSVFWKHLLFLEKYKGQLLLQDKNLIWSYINKGKQIWSAFNSPFKICSSTFPPCALPIRHKLKQNYLRLIEKSCHSHTCLNQLVFLISAPRKLFQHKVISFLEVFLLQTSFYNRYTKENAIWKYRSFSFTVGVEVSR